MKAMKKLGQGMLVAIAVLGLTGVASAGPKAISSCKTINEPGSYLVTKNLTAAGDCLIVTAKNVTIDLGGFVVSGPADGGGIGIQDDEAGGVNGTVIRNGTVTRFMHGIVLLGPHNVVDHVRVHGNGNVGMVVGQWSLVTNSRVHDNGIGGITIDCPSRVSGNIVVDNHNWDLLASGCVSSQNIVP
jgi:hypothetical protein